MARDVDRPEAAGDGVSVVDFMVDGGGLDVLRGLGDEELDEEGVEQARSGLNGTHRPALANHQGVDRVHRGGGVGQTLQLGEAAGVVAVAVGDEDVADVRGLTADRADGLDDLGGGASPRRCR